jgi:hypothetical protein
LCPPRLAKNKLLDGGFLSLREEPELAEDKELEFRQDVTIDPHRHHCRRQLAGAMPIATLELAI